MNWVIADLHLGHSNIIKYCKRPFHNVNEMDAIIINNWNAIVHPDDTVYCLGDLACGPNAKEKLKLYLPQLAGKIILIKGNHDKQAIKLYKEYGIAEVYNKRIKYQPLVILSHTPQVVKFPYINIHGHIHNNKFMPNSSGIYMNVSVEATDYKPVNLDDLINRLKSEQICPSRKDRF